MDTGPRISFAIKGSLQDPESGGVLRPRKPREFGESAETLGRSDETHLCRKFPALAANGSCRVRRHRAGGAVNDPDCSSKHYPRAALARGTAPASRPARCTMETLGRERAGRWILARNTGLTRHRRHLGTARDPSRIPTHGRRTERVVTNARGLCRWSPLPKKPPRQRVATWSGSLPGRPIAPERMALHAAKSRSIEASPQRRREGLHTVKHHKRVVLGRRRRPEERATD